MEHAELPKLRRPIGRIFDEVKRDPAFAFLVFCCVVVMATGITMSVANRLNRQDTPIAAGEDPKFVVEPRIVTGGYSLVVIRELGTGARVLVIEGATSTGRVAVTLPVIVKEVR